MKTLTIAEFLKFARLQAAAEALIRRGQILDGKGEALASALRDGNLHNSRFTAADSQSIALHWVALDQQANTTSGFSGTLFKCLVDDPITGAKAGELVLSFRSTEFIDDAARDNLATNTLEIKNTGFAWGQLADMEAWYARLRSEGKIAAGDKFSVTGYSLGGHLATAFNLMHPNAAQKVVTFNGAGLGKVKFATDDVLELVQGFVELRNSPDLIASRFSDATLATVYQEINRQLAKPIWDGIADYQERLRLLDVARNTLGGYRPPVQDPNDPLALALKAEVAMITRALDEITSLVKEAERVGTLTSGDAEASRPLRVLDQDIGAESLGYRMAVQLIAERSVSASLIQGGVQAFGAKAYLPPYGATNPIGNQFDVVGDANPSMVAHSQWHIGRDVRIFIEDQPLFRGGVGEGLVSTSLDYGDIKLLVDGYATKDFGDTHSLVLLVDSLAIQNTLLRLLPEAARDLAAQSLGQILRNASNLRKKDGDLAIGTGQGQAEGDVLENVANALGRMMLGSDASRLKGSPEGNTWAAIDDGGGYTGRESLYALLAEIQRSDAYNQLLGLVQLNTEPPDPVAARSDFGVLMSLVYQTPFTLTIGKNVPPALQVAGGDLYARWLADSGLAATAGGPAPANFSDQYLATRAEYVTRVMYYNNQNARYDTSSGGAMPGDEKATLYDAQSPDTIWEDKGSAIKIQRGNVVTANTQHVAFGGDLEDALQGGERNDLLFGGAGNDSLVGAEGDDHLEGDAGDDTLDGGLGNDVLMGGQGMDRFRFAGAWGRDTIQDADGAGSILLDGEALTGGQAAGSNVWISKTASGKVVSYTVVDAASSRTGQQLVIRSETSPGNTITVDHFDRGLAAGDAGYLGVRLTGDVRLVVTEGLGKNYFAQPGADPATLSGRSSDLTAGRLFSVSLNQAASAGQTLQLVLEGAFASGTKAVLGDRVVVANGATIELQEGQAQVSFALLAPDASNGTGSLQLVLKGQDSAVVSNTWGLSVQAAPSQYNVLEGDFTKLVSSSGGFVFDGQGNYRADAANPVAPGAADLIQGSSQADRISGGGGNDLLFGRAGNDRLEGGDGDDVLQGGLGADMLEGGAGNDLIYGSSTGSFTFPTDPNWTLPPNLFPPVSTGFGWAVYSEFGPDLDGRINLSFSKEIQKDKQDGDQGNSIDAGAGDDLVAAGTGDDQVRGGIGSDDLYGMAGADVLLGEGGDDRIYGDGPAQNLSGNSIVWAPAAQHGSDFLDGGDGNDILLGQGGADTVYGGIGDDRMWGDDRDPVNTPVSAHGDDYLDGEDGNDTIIGGGRDDTLYGGDGNDILKGDDEAARLAGEAHGADYIDGEAGDDTVWGGGAGDRLFGGDGMDRILGDDSALDALFDGDDLLDGEAGDDVLVGGGASDRLYGGGGNDRLFGDGETRENVDLTLSRHGDDYMEGGEGKDLLVGGGGSDTLLGGAGDDDIEGDGNGASGRYEANDWIDGGEGADLLRGGGGADVILGGEGSDQVWGDAGNDDLQGGAGFDLLYGGMGNDRLQGGADDDHLYGGDGGDNLYGGVGNDLLSGGAGDDMLSGGDGDDTLETGEGSDVVRGGAGNNTFLVKVGAGDILIESGSEADLVKFEAAVRLGSLSGFAADGELVLDLSTEQRVRVRGNANFLIDGQVINGAVLAALLGATGRPGPGAPLPAPATTTTNLYDPVGRVVGSVIRSQEPNGAVTSTIYLGPDGSGPKLSRAWNSDDGSFGSETYDLDGFFTGSRHNADGTYTQYETYFGGSYEVTFSAQSVILADAWTTTAGIFSGVHGTTTYHADGTYSAISYAPDGSYLTTTNDGDGNAREQSFDAAGNPVSGGRVAYGDGTFALIENDGKGTVSSTFFRADGVRLGQQIRLPDGSHGATTFSSSGASVSTLYRRDGTYSKSEDNGEGHTLTRNYAMGARLLGSSVTEVNGQTSITTFLDASGKKLRESWTRSDGTTGTDPVSASDYNGVANRIAPTFARNPLRFQFWGAPDGAGGRSDHTSGNYGEDWWTGGDRPAFQGEFHVTTWSPTEIDAYYRLRANGPNFSTRYSMEVGYTSPALAQPFQNNTWKQAGYYLLFDFLTGATVIGRASTTGRKYLQINSGTLTEIGSLTAIVHQAIAGSGGNYSVMDDDGLGNVSLTSFSSTGVRLGEMWFHNDGSSGADIYQADGTIDGVSSNADGTIDQYRTLAGGEIRLTSYPGAQGLVSVATVHAPDTSSDPVLAAPMPLDLGVPPDSSYEFDPIIISRGSDTYRALFDGAGNVEVSFDAGGGLSLSGYRVRTDPGYDSEVTVAGTRYDWAYDVRGVPTSRVVRTPDGSLQTFTLDSLGRVNGTSLSKASEDGSTTTLKYGAARQFIGSSLEMKSEDGQVLTREFDARGKLIASTLEVTDGHGNAVVSTYGSDGVLTEVHTRVVTAPNETTVTIYDASGTTSSIEITRVRPDGIIQTEMYSSAGVRLSIVVAAFESDGSVTTSNYDGAAKLTSFVLTRITPERDTILTAYDANGHKQRDDVLHASGVHEYATYSSDGAMFRTVMQVDGSYQTVTRDETGTSESTWFSVSGAKLSDTWSRADGAVGSSTYNSDGSWSAVATYSDGGRSTSIVDAAGTTTTKHFSAAGTLVGTTVTREAQGGFESTTFNAAGVKTNAALMHLDGSSAEYVYQPTGAFTGTVRRIDGSHDDLSGSALGVVTISHYNAAGGLISSVVNHAPAASATTLTSGAQVGRAFTLALPQGIFTDSDAGDVLSYKASLSGSAYLPEWMTFDAASRTLAGTPVPGAIGSVAIEVTAIDREGAFASKLVTIQVAGVRSTPISAQAAIEDRIWTFQVPSSVFSVQGDVGSVSYSASLMGGTALPSWLTFDSATRTFSGTPLNRDVGELSVSVTASDGPGGGAESSFSLAISNTNDAPEVWMPLDDQVVVAGAPFVLTLAGDAFRDVDAADVLTLSASLADGARLPSWMTFDPATRKLAGTPPIGEASSWQLTLTATDSSGVSASAGLMLSLTTGNHAPVLAQPLQDLQVEEGSAWAFTLPIATFMDTDAVDTLTYSARMADGSALPQWLIFDAGTRTFSGIPDRQDVGAIEVEVSVVDDEGEAARDSFTLTVARAPNLMVVGTPGDDVLSGRAGDDTIEGLGGADAMSGGRGDDTYFVDNAGDAVFESEQGGRDTVRTVVSYALAVNVEDLTLIGEDAISGTGNGLDNELVGNHAANRLDGGAGADTLRGGQGDDEYVVDDIGDAVVENAGEGVDTVFSSVNYALASNVENLGLTGTADARAMGNELSNRLQGNAGSNVLDGRAGKDFMAGAQGDDGYVVDNSGDEVVEKAGDGTDTVYAAITYTLGANVEDLVLTGTSAIAAFGNAQDNRIQGNAAMNTLDGGGGADSMAGGAGDDTYFVDNAGDVVIENSAEGMDTVLATVTYSLGANVENLVLGGTSDLRGMGNDLTNRIQGNAGSNTLDGGVGADILLGGAGSDAYVVDDVRDITIELASEGVDTVYTSVSHTLTAHIENLVLTGNDAIRGTGNELANRLQGNAAANLLDGGAGADQMLGGAGDDSYVLDSINDMVIENAGEGKDTVYVGATYILGANVENLVLTGTASADAYGNSLDNALKGNSAENALVGGGGNDGLDGAGGADLVVGGAGDDTYYFNRGSGADLVVEWGGSANDLAQFGSGIAADQLWFSRSGANLVVQVIGTSDSMTMRNWYGSTTSSLISFATQLLTSPDSISNWFTPSAYRVDWFRTSDGRALHESQVQNLVNAMASFSPPPAGQTTLSPQYQASLSATFAANWQ